MSAKVVDADYKNDALLKVTVIMDGTYIGLKQSQARDIASIIRLLKIVPLLRLSSFYIMVIEDAI
ncbi:hypothetical protein [Desulfosporosinus acidiphilus]|uniref:hypothetical protein n=1 Tax=Desulfosporosinus acidiphilus TaxID=885581 RepID=UPI0011D2C69D|nr:hypothetical protein [Desulfosporosinus acidiphilus]